MKFLDIGKCKSYTTRVKYLGLIITTKNIEMDPEKVVAMVAWALPWCIEGRASRLRICEFLPTLYSRVSATCKALATLTRNDPPPKFPFSVTAESPAGKAFKQLKYAYHGSGPGPF